MTGDRLVAYCGRSLESAEPNANSRRDLMAFLQPFLQNFTNTTTAAVLVHN
jgi:hypothetical protein